MADLNTNGVAQAGADAIKHEGATMMRLWQDNASRMMRANERVMHGMIAALKLEIELGQQLVTHRMDTIKQATQADKPAAAGKTVIDRSVEEMEHLTAMLREVTREMHRSFGDATNIIFDRQAANPHEALAASPPPQAAKSPPPQAAKFVTTAKSEPPSRATAEAEL